MNNQHRHHEIGFLGFKSRATAIGLLTLVKELRATGALSDDAVDRIETAITEELALARPPHQSEQSFREILRARLSRLIGRD